MKRYNLKVSGRVQGVGYRFFTQNAARKFGVVGWVKNLSDGRVEAEIQADPQILEVMLKELNRGPSFGKVTDLLKHEIPVEVAEKDFQILH